MILGENHSFMGDIQREERSDAIKAIESYNFFKRPCSEDETDRYGVNPYIEAR